MSDEKKEVRHQLVALWKAEAASGMEYYTGAKSRDFADAVKLLEEGGRLVAFHKHPDASEKAPDLVVYATEKREPRQQRTTAAAPDTGTDDIPF